VRYRTALFTAQEQNCSMKKNHEPSAKVIKELTSEMAWPRAAASVLALIGYKCSRCGSQFPETRPRKGRTVAESKRIEQAHAAREFALHVCSERGWPPVKRSTGPKRGSKSTAYWL
jgi:hypothetical protein